MEQVATLSPWARAAARPMRAIRAAGVPGDSPAIGVFVNFKRSAPLMADAVEDELRALLPGARFQRYTYTEVNTPELSGPNAEAFKAWVGAVDAAVFVVGDCGACTKYLVHDAVSCEELGKRAVAVVNEGFLADARSAASARGLPGLRLVAQRAPCESDDAQAIRASIVEAAAKLRAAVTAPADAAELAPPAAAPQAAEGAVFQGSNEEFNRFYYKRGWGDGLPLVPPTDAAVREMLRGTDLAHDHCLGELEPRRGFATVEKIAINAVMAGALPVHLPVILSCVEALLDPLARFGTFNVSTGSWAPFWIVNGPIREDIHVNHGSGALSPGSIANSAIGRALALIVRNIGGARPGIEDMGVLGNPMKFSSVLAEDEAQSPWPPLHVDAGVAAGESAVTLFFPNSYSQLWPYQGDANGILNALIYNLQPGRGGLTCILLPPVHAQTLARAGWNKAGVQAYISEYARVPAYRHRNFYDTSPAFIKIGSVPANPMDSMRIIRDPSQIRIVVTGGAGAFMGIASGSPLEGCGFVTRQIALPRQWSALVDRYKPVHPRYER